MSAIVAQAQAATLGCPPATCGTFRDAFDFIFHERESVSGGVCIGGPGELRDLAATHLLVSLVAMAIAIAVLAVPLGLWLGHIGQGEFLAVSVSNVGRAVPSLALLAFFVAFVGIGLRERRDRADAAGDPADPDQHLRRRPPGRPRDASTPPAASGMTEVPDHAPGRAAARHPHDLRRHPHVRGGGRRHRDDRAAGNVDSLGNPIIEPADLRAAGQLGAAIVVALITLAVDAGLGLVQRRGHAARASSAPRPRRTSKRFSAIPAQEDGDPMSRPIRALLALLAVLVLALRRRRVRRRRRGAPARGGGSADPAATTDEARRSRRTPANAGKTITVGSKNFAEQYILGEIYAQALEAAGLQRQEAARPRLRADRLQGAQGRRQSTPTPSTRARR